MVQIKLAIYNGYHHGVAIGRYVIVVYSPGFGGFNIGTGNSSTLPGVEHIPLQIPKSVSSGRSERCSIFL